VRAAHLAVGHDVEAEIDLARNGLANRRVGEHVQLGERLELGILEDRLDV